MSISRMTLTVPCPNCGSEIEFSLLSTIDGGRNPELRAAILDRSLQQKSCEVCRKAVRPPPIFMYFDRGSSLWVSAYAWADRDAWQEREERARTNFQTVYDSGSSIGQQMRAGPVRARVTFGWEALREKIFAAEHGIDDVLLEICKRQWIQARLTPPGTPGAEHRLTAVSGNVVILSQITPGSEEIVEKMRISHAEFEWQMQAAGAQIALKERLEQVFFVDVHRLETASN